MNLNTLKATILERIELERQYTELQTKMIYVGDNSNNKYHNEKMLEAMMLKQNEIYREISYLNEELGL